MPDYKPIYVNRALVFSPIVCILVYGSIRLHAGPGQISPERTIMGKRSNGSYLVPTGQTIDPEGTNLSFDGRPLDMAMRPDGKMLAVMLGDEIRLLDTSTNAFIRQPIKASHNFGGIVWSKDGSTLYSSGTEKVSDGGDGGGGGGGAVLVTHFDSAGAATAQKPIRFPLQSRISPNLRAKSSFPCALALSPNGSALYVALFNNSTVTRVDLRTYNPATGAAQIVETKVGSSPDRVIVSPGGDKLYVANRGGRAPEDGDTRDNADPVVVDPNTYKASTATISVINTSAMTADAEHAVVKTIPVGLQPADMLISKDGKYVFTANANGETVSVISAVTDEVIETIPTSPAPGKLAASSPNGLAIAPDGRTLYVTLGGDNAIEIVSLDKQAGGAAYQTAITGLIPTAWFPLGVRLSSNAKTLYVANSKGIGSLGPIVDKPRAGNGVMSPEMGPGGVVDGGSFVGHSVYAVKGSVSIISVLNAGRLQLATAMTKRNDHFDRMQAALTGAPDPFWSRFKHVILIIKENRTFDQILGDIPVPAGHIGGDPKLVMFGRKITPNQHALAREFGLLDNFYCSGEISADGHHWLNEAFASDYSERMMNDYPRSYPCCGSDPLVFAGNPFLWQAAMQAGRSFYNYGEFPPLPSMQRHSDRRFSAAFQLTADRNADVAHCERVVADLTGNRKGDGADSHAGLAQLTTIWFGNNHTSGTKPGAFTPESDVADNDLAVGKLVDAVTHSKKYWQDEPTAIFVVEDDAQGGLDHVDGHRTCGLVISPYNRRRQVISFNFNQLSMVRTIELMLSIKPLNQFDAAAIPMRVIFQESPDFTRFTSLKNEVALNLRNPPANKVAARERHWEEVSATLDFSAPDRADPEKLTEVLWHHTHGSEVYPPADAAY